VREVDLLQQAQEIERLLFERQKALSEGHVRQVGQAGHDGDQMPLGVLDRAVAVAQPFVHEVVLVDIDQEQVGAQVRDLCQPLEKDQRGGVGADPAADEPKAGAEARGLVQVAGEPFGDPAFRDPGITEEQDRRMVARAAAPPHRVSLTRLVRCSGAQTALT
jgi:hypothetical protein